MTPSVLWIKMSGRYFGVTVDKARAELAAWNKACGSTFDALYVAEGESDRAHIDELMRGLPATTRVFDMHFGDFLRDEIGMVRRIYAHFDRALAPEAETRMRRFLADNPADKHGRHRYTLAAAGLDPAVERRRYAAYQQHFGVASEAAV